MPGSPEHPSLFEQEWPQSPLRTRLEEQAAQTAWAESVAEGGRPRGEDERETAQDDLGGGTRDARLGQLPGQNVPTEPRDPRERVSRPTSRRRRPSGSTGAEAARQREAETQQLLEDIRGRSEQDRADAHSGADAARAALATSIPPEAPEVVAGAPLSGESAVALHHARTKLAEAHNANPDVNTVINPGFDPDEAARAREALAEIPRQVNGEVDHLGNPTDLINP